MEKYFKRYEIKSEPFNPEILCSILWELEINGINEEENNLFVFVPENSNLNTEKISFELEKLKKENLIENFSVTEDLIQNKNWNEEWEKNINVVKVSDRIIIKPSFREYKKEGDEIVITIDPKMSFGTGEHATTKLVILMLEKYLRKGDKVLDVGSGTGILSIAAIKLGASSALAIDNDEWCYDNGQENCRLNNVDDEIEICNCEIKNVSEKNFPLIISNIQKNVLLDLSSEFKERITDDGRLILSGILDVDKEEMIEHYSKQGFKFIESTQMEEWIAMVFKNNN